MLRTKVPGEGQEEDEEEEEEESEDEAPKVPRRQVADEGEGAVLKGKLGARAPACLHLALRQPHRHCSEEEGFLQARDACVESC